MSMDELKERDWRGYMLSAAGAAVASFLWMHLTVGTQSVTRAELAYEMTQTRDSVQTVALEVSDLARDLANIDRRLSRIEGQLNQTQQSTQQRRRP